MLSYSNPPPEGLSRPPLPKDWASLEISPERNYATNAKVYYLTENVKNFLSAFSEPNSIPFILTRHKIQHKKKSKKIQKNPKKIPKKSKKKR